MGQVILEARDLRKEFSGFLAVDGVDLKVEEGTVHALIGPNGAGKTTTFNLLTKFIDPTSGSIFFRGQDITRMPPAKIAKLGMVRSFQISAIFPSLTVHENLMLPPVVADGGFSAEAVYEMFPNLYERKNNQGTKLSGGEQQMLAIGRILRTGARVLLLDEPTEGLAPVIVQKIGQIIQLLKDRGYTILLVEQNFHFVSNLADRNYIIENGVIVDLFNREELGRNIPKVESYLGI